LARDVGGLRYELDFPRKLRRSFQTKTVLWITAAVAIGVVFAVMPARTKRVPLRARTKSKDDPKEGILGAGLALAVLKLAVTLLKPTVTNFISKKVSGYAASAGRKR
jgi:hypothetical protein